MPAMTRRTLHLRELDPAHVDDYRRAHDEIWPDLVALYRASGIVDVSCFIQNSTLAVMVETDMSAPPSLADTLARHPLECRWQERMRQFDLSGGTSLTFAEIYRQSSVR